MFGLTFLQNPNIFPIGNYRKGKMASMKSTVSTAADIGTAVRKKRKAHKLTLAEAAGLCNVNYRFLSDLENGKPTVRLDKVLQVLKALGLDLALQERGWPDA